MFKVGFDLPSEVVKDAPKQKKKSQPLGVDELQNMFNELKPKAAKERSKEPAQPKPEPRAAEPESEAGAKSEKRSKKQAKADKAKDGKAKADQAKDGKPAASSAKAEKPGKSEKPAKLEKPATAAAAKQRNDKSTNNAEAKPEARSEARSEADRAPAKRKGEDLQRPAKKLTPLQLKMQQKLSGARFRWINEQLYTTDSAQAFDIFQKQPEVFKEYHDGFRQQVEQWPENPVLSFVQQFQDRLAKPLNAPGGLPGDKASNTVTVADMGCGEAELALRLGEEQKGNRRRPRFQVHSFDMNKANERITVADIANVPLPDESSHVVVYCLALMGTNLADFINEGIRVLKPHGLVWIAEIKSRFEGNDYSEFVQKLKDMGLYHRTTDDSNKMFVKFEFVKLPHKLARAQDKKPEIHLKPCIYKRR